MNQLRNVVLGLFGLVLVVAVALQGAGVFQAKPEPSINTPLAEMLPASFPGWEVEDLELGATESIRERSENLLNLDDFVFRQYAKGAKEFGVYVAYWQPGKMPVRLVNSHTPDRCWVGSGWTCTARAWNVDLSAHAGVPLQTAQKGTYEIQGYAQHVIFWHIVDGEAHWYGGERENRFTSPTVIVEDLAKFGLNVHREQFFVRVTSPEPFDALWETPEFRAVMAALGDLCLTPGDPIGIDGLPVATR